MTFTDHLC